MLLGPRPFVALQVIDELELGPVVFPVPEEHDAWTFPHAVDDNDEQEQSRLFEYAINLALHIERMTVSRVSAAVGSEPREHAIGVSVGVHVPVL
eukprot:EC684803.1.p1 GENE.EC684803.1~~EC684803.1.p1  ORF type:complete len:94 (+),score=32.85 EC684803.1:168-449(+)